MASRAEQEKAYYAHYHPGLIHTQRVIKDTYGVETYVKPKVLHKFGRTRNADDSVRTTLAEFQDAVINETYLTTNTIDKIVSTDNGDTQIIGVEGHTYDGTDFTFVTQTVTLTGQTAATLSTPLARCSRLAVATGESALAGDVAAYVDGAITLGKPNTDADVKNMIKGTLGYNQSQKAATTFSSVDYAAITQVYASIDKEVAASNAEVILETSDDAGTIFTELFEISLRAAATSAFFRTFDPPIIIPANSDVRMIAVADAANTIVTGGFDCYLLTVDTIDYT
jgi:hypothetical protein